MASVGGDTERDKRLCGLITRSLRLRFPSLVPSSIPSAEAEKDLLISLTSVYREIQRWTDGLGCSESEQLGEVRSGADDCYCLNLHLEEGHACLDNIISTQVSFLTVKNPYICHVAGNILVAISNFLAESGRSWQEFLHLLWISWGKLINTSLLLPSTDRYQYSGDKDSRHGYSPEYGEIVESVNVYDHDDSSFNAQLLSRWLTGRESVIANLTHVLRSIFKSIKLNYHGLVDIYVHFAVSSLSKVPWDSLCRIKKTHTVDAGGAFNNSYVHGEVLRCLNELFGALLQLFCSLMDQKDLDGSDGLEDFSLYFKISSLVPKLLLFCFNKHSEYGFLQSFRYLNNKALMLMIRFSFWTHWKCVAVHSWLKLIETYFSDLLTQSIPNYHTEHNSCIEESPFEMGLTYGVKEGISCLHLMRQANFLFLKCCFTMIQLSHDTGPGCFCTSSSITCRPQDNKREFYTEASSKLSKWIQTHAASEIYIGNQRRFTLSFMHLYMEEDDLLFEMLLQLMDAAVRAKEVDIEFYEEMDNSVIFEISSIFHPISIFHQFLFLLHYDHLVLIDYLISKDTGVQCVRYLLRALHVICTSWSFFVEFSGWDDEIDCDVTKKRKRCLTRIDFKTKVNLLRMPPEGTDSSMPHSMQSKRHNSGSNRRARHQSYENAKRCLLSLKASIENLYRKHLFPYNPNALLRSLTKFQELCKEQI